MFSSLGQAGLCARKFKIEVHSHRFGASVAFLSPLVGHGL